MTVCSLLPGETQLGFIMGNVCIILSDQTKQFFFPNPWCALERTGSLVQTLQLYVAPKASKESLRTRIDEMCDNTFFVLQTPINQNRIESPLGQIPSCHYKEPSAITASQLFPIPYPLPRKVNGLPSPSGTVSEQQTPCHSPPTCARQKQSTTLEHPLGRSCMQFNCFHDSAGSWMQPHSWLGASVVAWPMEFKKKKKLPKQS